MLLGKWGENIAAEYLSGKGYTILERNLRTSHGEIDLLASELGVLVFVEVKTRSSKSYGYPEDSITGSKRTHLLASAQAYLQSRPDLEGDWRIDVVAIEGKRTQADPIITHFENVITADGLDGL